VLRLTPALKAALVDRSSGDVLRELATSAGMVSLRDRALRLAAEGVTTFEEVDRVTLAE
jgi:type II secretory ATPase GspE/PulE/Tfp pilus assembly ATPase PilB-like protein